MADVGVNCYAPVDRKAGYVRTLSPDNLPKMKIMQYCLEKRCRMDTGDGKWNLLWQGCGCNPCLLLRTYIWMEVNPITLTIILLTRVLYSS